MKQESHSITSHNNTPDRPFSRRDFLSTSLKVGAAAFTTSLIPNLNVADEGRYNVLFIMVDDLRPLLGCYGYAEMHTPNIDRLAARGTVFNRAYCQWPLCSPSRTSYLTGLRPDTTGVTNNRYFFRETIPNVVTLPQHFKANGYHSQAVGRIFHLPNFQDDEYSWSVPSWRPTWTRIDYETTPSWQALDVEDDALRDGKTAERAVQVLNQIRNKQFFMAVGFFKPHLPFIAPKKYFDLYDNTSFDLPFLTGDSTAINPPHWNEVRPYQDIPDGNEPISYEKGLELVRAYAATTSYTDAQIGRVLDQLEALGIMETTVIAFCGDHGYNLLENGNFGKNIVYEATLHSPLIVSIPGQTYPGERTDALVELVDIFPTLCDACEIPIFQELEGLSMYPVIEQPSLPWKTAAFSQRNQRLSMRTDRYRYTEERNTIELYDYDVDPYSEQNIADLPENTDLVRQLSEMLHSSWQAALPNMVPQNQRPKTLIWDVNDDGIVDIHDLLVISINFNNSNPENPKVDVNMDGKVNILDLLIVSAHLGKSSYGASPNHLTIPSKNLNKIEEWLSEARLIGDGSPILQKGIENLELLLNSFIPKETLLLPNYPNPFNPETWIPYQLATSTDVNISIHAADGKLIRTLDIGYQSVGKYHHRDKAAYWDGKNTHGEPVANGMYFYTLSAGKFTATRKMLIRK
ncbi:hypothetical protein C6497_02360 [Candidatus Poribacteria bacterium]|nr:MAG: hypothetical protein C6497_02360 [Candidatus Poribacteria bacterium]